LTEPRDRGATWADLALFLAANVLFGAGLFAHAFLYNFLLQELALGEVVMGVAAASLTAGGLTALVPAGIFVDRVGARAAFFVAVLLACAGLASGAIVASPRAIYASAFVAGAGTAVWRVSTGPILMRLTEGATRSRAFSWNVALLLASGAIWTFGAGSLPSWLERTLGTTTLHALRWSLVAGAAGTALAALIFAFVPAATTRARKTDDGPSDRSGRIARAVESIRIPMPLAVAVLVIAVWMTAGGAVIPFFNIYFQREHALSITRIGGIFAAVQAVTALVVFGSGEAASRWGPRRMLLLWSVAFAPALWALTVVDNVGLAITLFLIQGCISPATNPLIDQVLLERSPVGRQGAVSSWRNAATELSGLIGSSAGGLLLQTASFAMLYAVAGTLAATGAIGLALVLRWLGTRGFGSTAAEAAKSQAFSPVSDASARIETTPRATS
jgi:predicted MFS family arabinose efflux permease